MWSIVSALVLASCTDPALEQRVADLESKVATLEKTAASAPAGAAARQGPSQEVEDAAANVAKQVQTALEANDVEKAKAACTELAADQYKMTRAGRGMRKACAEMQVIGIDAGQLEVEKWFQGKAAMGDGKATLLVFFESWCPHCKEEMPKIQSGTYTKYKSQGLNVVGVTKVTKSATDEKVQAFIQEGSIQYPIAKETGSLSERFQVQGIPAAAVVKDGKVVWRGHPARLTDAQIEGWLK
jgi:thiol-disulfide isomerase/thioredoxin